MLQKIRDKSSGPIAYAIVGLIALVFSVWGIGSYFTEPPNPPVASVAGRQISQYELQRAYNQRYQRLQRLLGEKFDPNTINRQQFRRSVLQGLVQQALLSQYAADQGYRVTDAALLNALTSDARFAVDGSFSTQRYRSLLAQAGISAAAFEAGLRDDLASQQVRAAVLDTAFVTSRAVAKAYRLAHQRRELATAAFDPADYRDQVELGPDEIQAWYQAHPQEFMREERLQLSYVLLDRSEIDLGAGPGETVLQTLYEQQKQRFQTPERRLARHILVRIDADTDADAARKKIQQLASKLESEDVKFAELARKASEDVATAESGGQLNWVSRGTMVKPLEDALFALEPGAVSAPVKTEFGWHLIKLEKIDAAETKPFDDPEVQAQLLALFQEEAREQRFRDMSQKMDALSFEAPNSLTLIAETVGLEIQTSGWITRAGGEGLGSNAAVVKAAFSDAVLKDELNSTPIQLGGNRLVVLRVAERQPPQHLPLDEVRDEIRERLRGKAAAALARAEAEQILAGLREGGDWQQLVTDSGAELTDAHWVSRDDADGALIGTAFAMPKPAGQAPQYAITTRTDGTIALLRLTAVEAPALDEAQANSKALAQNLRGRIAGLEYILFGRALRENYDVQVFADRLQ